MKGDELRLVRKPHKKGAPAGPRRIVSVRPAGRAAEWAAQCWYSRPRVFPNSAKRANEKKKNDNGPVGSNRLRHADCGSVQLLCGTAQEASGKRPRVERSAGRTSAEAACEAYERRACSTVGARKDALVQD